MTWTTEKPTRSGVYWYLYEGEEGAEEEILEISDTCQGLRAFSPGYSEAIPLDGLDGKWKGPINS